MQCKLASGWRLRKREQRRPGGSRRTLRLRFYTMQSMSKSNCGSWQYGVWSTKSFFMPTGTTTAPISHALLGHEKRDSSVSTLQFLASPAWSLHVHAFYAAVLIGRIMCSARLSMSMSIKYLYSANNRRSNLRRCLSVRPSVPQKS